MITIRHFGLTLAVCGALGLASCPAVFAQANYTFLNFDGPGDHTNGTFINGISSNGTEVGFSANAGGTTFTNFLRTPDGTFLPLSTLPSAAQANGVNAANTVVGTDGAGNAFVLNGLSLTTLPLANAGNTASQIAFGINDKGAVVGQYVNSATNTTPGFVYTNPTFTLFQGSNTALVTNVQGINNQGLATGFWADNNDAMNQHGFLYDSATQTLTQIQDPTTARTQAGLFLTQFLGLNDHNEAVGYYQTNNGSQFGFTYDIATQTYTFLDDPLAAPFNGVQITQITGIDNRGDLSGFFTDANGNTHGFYAAAVPEPGICTLAIGAGIAGAAFLRRRVRK